MSTHTSSADYGRFDELAEEFAARFRRGERPSLQEYIDRCPDLADEIRELFPALVEVERVEEDQPMCPGAAAPAVSLPPLGQVGDYRVIREVGRGGMGVVYEAEQVSLGRRVALKVLPRQVSQDLKTLARFRREARSAAQLHHTNIVPVFEVGKAGDVSYYAMQFIQGQGLDTVIDELRRLKERAHPTGPAKKPEPPHRPIPSRTTAAAPSRSRQVSRMAQSLLTGRFVPETPGGTGEAEAASADRGATAALTDRRGPDETEAPPASDPAPVAESSPPSSVVLPGGSQLSAVESGRRAFFRSVAHIGRQVAAALAYAHARGIVHRDIKPSNLLLDTEGVVWITDFGLAKASDDGLTQAGDILGTIRYMAPERFRGEGDGRADVYALGLTLYELLALRPAFDSPDRLQLIEQIKTENPQRPRALDTRIPRDLETIVLKAVHKDAKDRYPSADALGEDLRRFLADEPIRARRVGLLERAWIWARRRPAAAALVLMSGVAALALVGAVVAFAFNLRLSKEKASTEQALETAKVQRQRAEMYQYLHSVALVNAGWREGSLGQAEKLLGECPADQRHWEWRYLTRLCRAELLTLRAYTGLAEEFYDAVFSPDGTRIVSSGEDRTVKLWDARTGQLVFTFAGHDDFVTSTAFSPDGSRIAAIGLNGKVLVWDVLMRRAIMIIEGHRGFAGRTVAFSPDGARLAWANRGADVTVWDLATRRELANLPGRVGAIWSLAFSPDGTRIALGGDSVDVWNATDYKPVRTLKCDQHPAGHGEFRVEFSPDSTRLASGSMSNFPIIWDLRTGKPSFHLEGHNSKVPGVAFSPDGARLASGSLDGTVRVWDTAEGRPLLTLKGHSNGITSVAYSPDGSRLLTASSDGTVKIWDATSEPGALTIGVGSATVAFSPDGSQFATVDGNRVARIRDAKTGQVARTLTGPVNGRSNVAYSPDGSRIAAGCEGRTARVWEVGSGRVVVHLDGHSEEVRGVAFSADGARLATVCADQSVTVWDLTSRRVRLSQPGRLLRLPDYGEPFGISFSPDGRWLAAGSDDGVVRVWDADTGRDAFRLRGHASQVRGVAFHPASRWLASSGEDSSIKIWDLATGLQVQELIGHTGSIRCIASSDDGRRLFSASVDHTAKLWDVATGQEVLTLRAHLSSVWGVAISRDGERLATASLDRTVKIWDARPWTPDAAIEREAVGLLDALFAKPLCKADVIDYLRNAPTIRPRARQLALSLVDRYHEETNPETYHQASWALVRQPYLNVFQYRFALLQAEYACRLAPDRQEYRIGLGAALYRAGRYRVAIETLERADRLDQASPAALAFLAMAHHRLAQREQAQTDLARLREILDQPRRTKDPETLDLVHEAQALIPHDPIFPADPFAR